MTGVGNRLMRYTAAANAYVQYDLGILAWVRRVSPVSTMWRCFLSEMLLCSGVCGGEVKCEIPEADRNGLSAMNSPALSE